MDKTNKIKIFPLIIAILFILQYIPAHAANISDEPASLTVSEAVKKAIDNSSDIKDAADSESLADENVRKAYDSIFDSTTNASLTNAEVNLMSVEMSRALNIENIEAKKENVEYNVMKYFNTIINAEKEAELFEKSLTIQKKKLDISAVKLELGKMSQSDYDAEVYSYEENLTAKESNLSAIEKAYRDLNSYMGEDLDKKYSLVLNLTFEPMEEINLTQYTDTFINESLTVKQAENSVETAEYKVDNYSEDYNALTGEVSDSYNEYDSLVVDLRQANRNLADAKESIKTSIVNSYSELNQTISDISGKEKEIESFEKQLEILNVKYELGKATELEVIELEYSIESAEEELRQLKNGYALSCIAFSNPNILLAV